MLRTQTTRCPQEYAVRHTYREELSRDRNARSREAKLASYQHVSAHVIDVFYRMPLIAYIQQMSR
jgi:hypothetical protein